MRLPIIFSRIALIIVLLITSIVRAEIVSGKDEEISITINFNNENNLNNKVDANLQTCVKVDTPPSWYAKGQQLGINTYEQASSFTVRHKKKCIFFSLVGSYLATRWYFYNLQRKILRTDDWGSWNGILPLEELAASDQEQLISSLMHTVQVRYISIQNLDDTVTPLVSFMRDVERERQTHNRYAFVSGMAAKLYLGGILRIYSDVLAVSRKKMKRLTFLQNLFIAKISSDKVNIGLYRQ
jgi:hypothetical protein